MSRNKPAASRDNQTKGKVNTETIWQRANCYQDIPVVFWAVKVPFVTAVAYLQHVLMPLGRRTHADPKISCWSTARYFSVSRTLTPARLAEQPCNVIQHLNVKSAGNNALNCNRHVSGTFPRSGGSCRTRCKKLLKLDRRLYTILFPARPTWKLKLLISTIAVFYVFNKQWTSLSKSDINSDLRLSA